MMSAAVAVLCQKLMRRNKSRSGRMTLVNVKFEADKPNKHTLRSCETFPRDVRQSTIYYYYYYSRGRPPFLKNKID